MGIDLVEQRDGFVKVGRGFAGSTIGDCNIATVNAPLG